MKKRIIVRCKRCNHRMFDCIVEDKGVGSFSLEMKCTKCARVLTAKGKSFEKIHHDYESTYEAVLKI